MTLKMIKLLTKNRFKLKCDSSSKNEVLQVFEWEQFLKRSRKFKMISLLQLLGQFLNDFSKLA
jgi:hypothetical protein